jgi:hypothetical protein
MLLQMVFEFGHRDVIDTRSTLVLDHPLIRKLKVTAFYYRFPQSARLRFRLHAVRRARLGTHESLPRCRPVPLT